MKLNSSIFAQVALSLTLLGSSALSVNAKEVVESTVSPEQAGASQVVEAEYKADLYLDALDADGHLSILDIESHAQKAIAEPKAESQVAKNKVKESTTAKVKKGITTTKAEYLENKSSVAAAAKAKLDKSHGGEHGDKAHKETPVATKAKADKSHGGEHKTADSHGGDAGYGKKSGNSFLTAHTTEIEFTFAILVIVLGLIASERFQRAQENRLKTSSESELGLEEV